MKLGSTSKLPAGNGRKAAAGLVQFGAAADVPAMFAVDIDKVTPDPEQPRRRFDEAELQQLAQSISSQGLLQPILVVPDKADNGRFTIVAGERRWRASKLAGKPTINAIIVKGDPAEIALIENMQRKDLTVLEEARALQRLQIQHGYNQSQLAEIVAKDRENINKLFRILSMPADILDELDDQDVPLNTLTQVARIEDPDVQRQAWGLAKEGRLTFRMAKEMAQRAKEPTPERAPVVEVSPPQDQPPVPAPAERSEEIDDAATGSDTREPVIGADATEQGSEEEAVPRLRPRAPAIHETFFRQLAAVEKTLERGALDRSAITPVERARLEAMRLTIDGLLKP